MNENERLFNFSIKYMVGDDDGFTEEEAIIAESNPFLHPITQALISLKSPKGSWGISLEESTYTDNYIRGIITKYEHDLLCIVTDCWDYNMLKIFCEENNLQDVGLVNDQLAEFDGLFRDRTENSFLTYVSHKVKEHG